MPILPAFLWLFGLLLLSSCSQRAAVVAPQLYTISAQTEAGIAADTTIAAAAALIAPYKAQLDASMNRQLAIVKTPLVKASPEGNLGNWMADIMQKAAEAEFPDLPIAFAATNAGGLRVNEIGTGPLLVSEIYELMPFDNQLVVLTMKGTQVKAFLAHIANSGGWPVSAKVQLDQTKGPLQIRLDGEEISPGADYHVATIDYVANGGSNSSMLRGIPQRVTGKFLRDILIEYAAKMPEIDVRSTGKRMRL